ncbi:hypothetical protein GM661_00410 [Iocasia frigidifontis]|uniref:Uncharacterized protein n=1 Tax=Iocasia fonsfrigidae TaxID=2682810 RepID=A0A8A7K8U2_9FIRM|nr:hypothetical protein [Iocasia fonsfrigidae]QTL96535.1 hypothetical protein GM661_00410 [Iocasia fonsfrigidae]
MSCPNCGLPNYEGLCPVCEADEQAYMEELHWAFGDFYEGQTRNCENEEEKNNG